MGDRDLPKLTLDFDESIELPRSASNTDDVAYAQNWKELEEVADVVKLLDEETFDFDLSVSPQNTPNCDLTEKPKTLDHDEEIFFGPVRYKEICVATAVNEEEKVTEKFKPLSPLSASEMAQLCQEAFTVSCRIRLATGAKDLAESCDEPSTTGSASASPCLAFSPLDEVLTNFSKVLPPEKRLSCDENGVVKFQGARYKDVEKKPTRQSVSRLCPNPHQLTKESLMQKPAMPRRSWDSFQNLPNSNVSENVSSCLTKKIGAGDGADSVGQSPMTKRFRSEHGNAVESCVEANTVSHTNSNSSMKLAQLAGKRQLPAPKIKLSGTSQPPQLSALKPSLLARPGFIGIATVISDAACSGGTNASPATLTSHLQRSSSLRLGRPIVQAPWSKTPVPLSGISSSESFCSEETQCLASKPVAPKTDLIGGAAQRKILTAVRNRPLGSGIGQGPLKAVGPLKGAYATVSSQDKDMQLKPMASVGPPTPQRNTHGNRASIGGTTPGSVSRVRLTSGLPAPSKLKAPDFSSKLPNHLGSSAIGFARK